MKQCVDADNLHRRLKKIIGQVQAIDRMVDEDVPCEDILSQINAAKSALNGCGKVVLEGHIQHCVRDGIQHGDADKTIESFTKAVERFANMQQPLHASEKSAVWADFFLYTINGPDASEASGPLVYEAVQSASTAARTSSIRGMDAAAPGRVTEMAEAMDAYCMAVCRSMPCARQPTK